MKWFDIPRSKLGSHITSCIFPEYIYLSLQTVSRWCVYIHIYRDHLQLTTKHVTDPHLRCVTDLRKPHAFLCSLRGSWSNAGRSNWDEQKWHQDLATGRSFLRDKLWFLTCAGIECGHTRWAPTSCKWSYNPISTVITSVTHLFSPIYRGYFTPFITGYRAHLVHYSERFITIETWELWKFSLWPPWFLKMAQSSHTRLSRLVALPTPLYSYNMSCIYIYMMYLFFIYKYMCYMYLYLQWLP